MKISVLALWGCTLSLGGCTYNLSHPKLIPQNFAFSLWGAPPGYACVWHTACIHSLTDVVTGWTSERHFTASSSVWLRRKALLVRPSGTDCHKLLKPKRFCMRPGRQTATEMEQTKRPRGVRNSCEQDVYRRRRIASSCVWPNTSSMRNEWRSSVEERPMQKSLHITFAIY